MIRIAIFTNNRNMPHSLKENFKKQMNWILDTFPHNGYNPPYGDVWRQSGAKELLTGRTQNWTTPAEIEIQGI